MIYTKMEIDRLGDIIRQEGSNLSDNTLIKLQEYRIAHKETLASVFNVVCNLNRKVNKDGIVTYRIKRFESIIGKLKRYPEMRFNRMWDIGGCRCILKNNEQVYKLKDLLLKESNIEIRKEYDYIQSPQKDGYKSLHLFLSIKGYNEIIELQLRNQEDHNWATLVEITDLLFDTKLKEYGDHEELLRLHLLLSKRTSLGLDQKKEITKIIRKYKFLDKLSDVFSGNYINVRKQWLEIESLSNQKYFLIETTKNQHPKIRSYKNFIDAENTYLHTYKSLHNSNIVLTHLPSPNYRQISIAYSNYILTFHSFFDDCYGIFEDLIEEALINKQYLSYIKYFNVYVNLVLNHLENLTKEAKTINNIISTKPNKNKLRVKEKEWMDDIKNQIHKRKMNSKKLEIQFEKNMPNSLLEKNLFVLISFLIIKFNKIRLERRYAKINNG